MRVWWSNATELSSLFDSFTCNCCVSNISESDNETSEGHVIFVKNLNFDTNEDLLKTVTWDIFFYFWPSYLRQKIIMQVIRF